MKKTIIATCLISLFVICVSASMHFGAFLQDNKMNQEKLAQRVEKVDENIAKLVRDEKSKIERIATPFFKNGAIYKVEKFAPSRPIITFIGCDDKDFTVTLNANPEGYFDLATKSGLNLGSKDLRLNYILTFFATTKGAERFQVVEKIDDIKQRPNLDETNVKKFKEFRDKYAKTIAAPTVSDNTPHRAVIFAVKGQSLIKIDAVLSPDGKINLQETTLEKELLIPYSL
ncbi:MAG: hypothetical protein H7Z37_10905 [Pyrinomonadaceae bacterium]|nr:hypothetical protein [Pyrinomonadaceae bacterium]